jgi:hypothetical protein
VFTPKLYTGRCLLMTNAAPPPGQFASVR